MKKLLIVCLLIAPAISRAQSAGYVVNVKLKTLKKHATAYLVSNFGWTNQQVLDSVASERGTFLFKGTVDDITKASVVIDHTGSGIKKDYKTPDALLIFLENGNINITGTDSVKHALISGSKLNSEYARYDAAVLASTEKKMEATNAAYLAAPEDKRKDKQFLNELMVNYRLYSKERDSLKYVYIKQHPDSYFSLMALAEMTGNNNDKALEDEAVFKSLSARLRNTNLGQGISKMIDVARPTTIGAMAPDFTENDVNDKPVTLSDLRGKYVLLDFWASWCGPCRAENPNVVKAYSKYKDKNFTVLGVSLDQAGKKDAWLAAIKADGLTWTQVSDLQFWNNAAAKKYMIRSIPQNFLIDPSGKIIAKNLRGEALDARLAMIFDNTAGK